MIFIAIATNSSYVAYGDDLIKLAENMEMEDMKADDCSFYLAKPIEVTSSVVLTSKTKLDWK